MRYYVIDFFFSFKYEYMIIYMNNYNILYYTLSFIIKIKKNVNITFFFTINFLSNK